MTFFTLLYHSGDDGAVTPTPPPTVSNPGFVGGGPKEEPRKRKARQRDKNLPKGLLLERKPFPPLPDELSPEQRAETAAAAYEQAISGIERAARAATTEFMRQRTQVRELLAEEYEEAIALLLLMG